MLISLAYSINVSSISASCIVAVQFDEIESSDILSMVGEGFVLRLFKYVRIVFFQVMPNLTNAELPFLQDGSTIVEGFDDIISHLRSISKGQWDLDARLSAQQKADCMA